ncbi:MAG: DUF1611 domain-containing protein [Bacteroidales bacterium]|jgi:uncharacterized NAD-dependent epimerase/dehydratase family protein|nr:DUF1611 domain-containing protein [Bacteroidales bacterium]
MSKKGFDGDAIVYCEGAYNTTNGKTAHGLVRYTERYNVVAVVDATFAGRDAGQVIDGIGNGIPIVASIKEAMSNAGANAYHPSHMVIGLAPDGGRLPKIARQAVMEAIALGLNIDCGLHDFLSDDPEIVSLAMNNKVSLRDIRKTPGRADLHFFTGEIETVESLKIAVLGTDSAVGKRTTAWVLVQAIRNAGYKAELIGTGQTAWLQGARYSMIMDSTINDFVSGEIEYAMVKAWKEIRPDVMVIEGQGSLLNPAYPGGFEILAAGRPDIIILQHAPARKDYDGFPGYPIHPLRKQIDAIEMISDKPVVAITVNHEDMTREETAIACERISRVHGLPAMDVLYQGEEELLWVVMPYIKQG